MTTTIDRRDECRDRLLLLAEGEQAALENQGMDRQARAFDWARREVDENNNLLPMLALRQLDHSKPFPVSIDQFLEDPQFMGYLRGDFDVWDTHRDRVRRMNPDVVLGEAPITEVALGGASGTGKTAMAWINMAYQFYLLSCFKSPQRLFGMASITPVVFTVQSLQWSITDRVIYRPFRAMLVNMPYVQRYCKFDNLKESWLDFDNGIQIIPVLARAANLQAQAVIGGILDELAFMQVIEVSKQVAGPRGMGGKFDQAKEVFIQTTSRRSRSFGKHGISIGCIFALSNTHYRGDFMDTHLDFIAEHNPPGVVAERMRRYEVEPGDVRDVRLGKTIMVQVGTDYNATKVVDDEHPLDEGASTILIPDRYKMEFLHDPDDALRNVAGISSAAIHPFIMAREKLIRAFDQGTEMGLVPYVDIQDADLHVHGMPNWVADLMPSDPKVPRFIHVDLSKSKDRCGIAIIKPYSTINVPDLSNPGVVKTVPTFAVECAITLTPSGNAHVEPADIRTWLIQLSTVHGINIGGVSYDGFQSQESLQMWRRAGVFAKEISVDRTMEQYEYFRASLYEDRVAFCQSEILMTELVMLEHDETANAGKGKVDHPPKGSKDISDAVCGAIYNCSRQRRYRTTTGYHREEGGMKVKVREVAKAGRPRAGQRPKSGSKKMARPTARPPQAERILLEEPPTMTETAEAPAWWKETHGLN